LWDSIESPSLFAIPLRYLCDVNCIAKIGIWRFGILGCDSKYDGICFAKFQYAKVCASQKWLETWIDSLCVFFTYCIMGTIQEV
jgi:hypothetical protein